MITYFHPPFLLLPAQLTMIISKTTILTRRKHRTILTIYFRSCNFSTSFSCHFLLNNVQFLLKKLYVSTFLVFKFFLYLFSLLIEYGWPFLHILSSIVSIINWTSKLVCAILSKKLRNNVKIEKPYILLIDIIIL